MANRHLSRIIIMQSLYEWDFRPEANLDSIVERNIENFKEDCDSEFILKVINGVHKNTSTIDKSISQTAPEWPLEQIASIDKTILRLAIFELLFEKEVPPKVVINEAVELAKAYGSENSSKFVNGVLGTLFKADPRYDGESKKAADVVEKELAEEGVIPIEEIAEELTLIDLSRGKPATDK